MILSNAYKKDILSKNTELIPLVIIEKFISEEMGTPENPNINYERIFLSTHNIQVDGHYFQPLLLKMPNLSQNIDLNKGKFQTSSLTLNISNIDYNNSKRISDKLDQYSLLNSVVCIHYKTQSCTILQLPNQDSNGIVNENTNTSFGCPRVFTGVIREISHQEDTITFTIEDITDKKITRELPNTRLGSTDNIPDKYKNTHIPMLYGRLENAPAVAEYDNGLFTVKADSMPINKVNEKQWGVDNYGYGGVILFVDDQYLGVTRKVHWEAIKESEATASERFYDVKPENPSQYNINDNGQVSFNYGSMLQVANRIEVLKTGSPKTILLNQNEGITIEHKEDDEVGNADVHIWEGYPEQHITNNNYNVATDGLMNTSFEKSLSSSLYWSNERNELITGAIASTLGVFYSLQWDSGISGADYVRVIQNKLNDTEIPVRGDANLPSGYGVWDNEFGAIWITDIKDQLADGGYSYQIYEFNLNRIFTMGELNTDLTDLISLGNDYTYTSPYLNTNVTMSYNPNADIKTTFSQEMIFSGTDAYNTPEIYPMIRLSSGSNTMPNAGQSWSSLEVVGSILNWQGGYNQTYGIHYRVNIAFDLDIKVEEIETTALAQFNEATENEFYLNAEGRTDTFLSEYTHTWTSGGQTTEVTNMPEILENPADVIRHILVQECGLTHSQFDEDEFNLAWVSRQQGGHALLQSPIKLAFSVNEVIDSKKLLEKISQNCLIFPRFKNDGKMGFVTLQRAYYPEYDYNLAREVDINDVVTYKFGLSKELVSKIDVSYNYSYGQGKNLKTTDAKQMTQQELDWYGIPDVEDSYLNYKADYIQDEASAIQLRDMIWYDRKANHLQIDLTLPLSYIDLEIGDLCKFPMNKLLGGIKAQGINYTVFDNYGGVLRVPLFKVIKVSKSLDSIRVTLHQLHWLDTQSNAINDMQSGLWDSIGLDNDLVDPLNPEEIIQDEIFVPFSDFFIGHMTDFYIGPYQFHSSHSRRFTINERPLYTSQHPEYNMMFNLKDSLGYSGGVFGHQHFGGHPYPYYPYDIFLSYENYQAYHHWLPSSSFESANWGTIGGFVAMEIRMTNANGSGHKILSLRNVKDSIFDEDRVYTSLPYLYYIPNIDSDGDDWIYSFENIGAERLGDGSEMKLGWVVYESDENWNYLDFYGSSTSQPPPPSNPIDINRDIWIHPTIDNPDFIQRSNMYTYEMVLYPRFRPTNHVGVPPSQFWQDAVDHAANLSLTYTPYLGSSLWYKELILGDVNLDETLNVLDAVNLAAYVLGNTDLDATQLLNADMNQDEIVDILDVILLINIVLGNE